MLNKAQVNDPQRAARVFQLFASGARVRIVELLKGCTLCVGALAARLEVSSAAVSQHLRILRDAGVVEREKRGSYAHYRLRPEGLAEVREMMERITTTPPKGEEGSCVKDADARSRKT